GVPHLRQRADHDAVPDRPQRAARRLPPAELEPVAARPLPRARRARASAASVTRWSTGYPEPRATSTDGQSKQEFERARDTTDADEVEPGGSKRLPARAP